MYSSNLGIFTERDPLSYVDGYSLYKNYFSPNSIDPSGLEYIPPISPLIGDPDSWCKRFCKYEQMEMDSVTKTGKTTQSQDWQLKQKDVKLTLPGEKNLPGYKWVPGTKVKQNITYLADLYDVSDVKFEQYHCRCKPACLSDYLTNSTDGWKESDRSEPWPGYQNLREQSAYTTGIGPDIKLPSPPTPSVGDPTTMPGK